MGGRGSFASSTRLWRVLGRRGCALLFFALLDLVYSFSLFAPPRELDGNKTLLFLTAIAPLPLWGSLWAVAGLVCLFSAFRQNDTAGFAAAIAVKVLWGLIFALGWVFADLERAYVAVAIWFAMAGWVAVIAGWPEDPRTLPGPPKE